MSDIVEDAIETLIKVEEPSAIITGYVYMAVYQTPADIDTRTHYVRGSTPGLDAHVNVGLARRLFRSLERASEDT